MPRLNKLFQIFQHGETGGPVLGVDWPFEPEHRDGYRVRSIAESGRGNDSVTVSVFAGETEGAVENDVPDGAIGLSLDSGTRIAIRESYFELTQGVEWVQSSLDDAVEVIWDPSDALGRGWNTELRSGLDVYQRFNEGTRRAAYDAERARIQESAAGYRDNLVASLPQDSEGYYVFPETLWTVDQGFLGAEFEGLASDDADVRYWLSDPELSGLNGLGDGLELSPNYSSLRFRTLYRNPQWTYAHTIEDGSVVRAARAAESSSPWRLVGAESAVTGGAGHIVTNKRDSHGKRSLVRFYSIPNHLQDPNNLDRRQFVGTNIDNDPFRLVQAIPDWIDPATLQVTERTFVRFISSIHASVYDAGPQSGAWFEVGDHAPWVRYEQRRRDTSGLSGIPTNVTGYGWYAVTLVVSSGPGIEPEPHYAYLKPQYTNVKDFYPNDAQGTAATAEVFYEELRESTSRFEYVSQDRYRELWNGLVTSVVDYFTPPGDIAEATFTPRLWPIRTEPNEVVGSLPRGSNLSQSRAGQIFSVPVALGVADFEPPLGEWDGFLTVTDMGFRGRIQRLPIELEIRFGLEWDAAAGTYAYREDIDTIDELDLTFQNFVFPTVVNAPGGPLIDQGGPQNLTGNRYPLVLTGEIASGALTTIQDLHVAPILPFTVNPGELISIVERIVPPSDDTRTIWGSTLERRSRNELVAGLDGTGNVEQTQTVDRAEFEVRATETIDAGMFLRDDGGRLWEIVGTADAPSRRNIILTCERVFDRRRKASTFPRFAVPIRRV